MARRRILTTPAAAVAPRNTSVGMVDWVLVGLLGMGATIFYSSPVARRTMSCPPPQSCSNRGETCSQDGVNRQLCAPLSCCGCRLP